MLGARAAADGSARLPEGKLLAGSTLLLDQALRNLVVWALATANEAMRMVYSNQCRLIAPAIAAGAAMQLNSKILWSHDLYSLSVEVGEIK